MAHQTFTLKAVTLLAGASLLALGASAQQPGALRLRNLPPELSEAKVRAHVIAPANVQNVEMEEVDPRRERLFQVPRRTQQFQTTPKLDIATFGTAAHTILKNNVTGYVLQVRKNGNLVYNLVWNWAQTPTDGKDGWHSDTRMHVASVSKFLTAVAMMKTLDAKGISYDAKISPYLPAYWAEGGKINQITFRQLMTHKSGFSTGTSKSDFAFMKAQVAAGVPAVGGYDYENMNFGLCRILIPILNGNVDKDAVFINNAALNDQAWDAVTLHHYKKYMQDKVFTPAGVNNASFAPLPAVKGAFAYKFPNGGQNGWNSGDLATVAGGAGWRLSTKELLNVMDHVRRKNTIIPAAKAQYLLDAHFGIDQTINTPAGKMYDKNGSWSSNGRKEQCVAYFMPDNIEVVAFVNSPIGAENFSLRGLVKDLYLNSLTD
jgi:CubicO group peptidase (beta-lactamase class C family)